jgi:hypothetical protein
MAKRASKAREKIPSKRQVDVPAAFGAVSTYGERFSIYIADRDQNGKRIDQVSWVRQAMELLMDINGGASALPAMDGIWKNPQTGEKVEERTIVVYSFVKPEPFVKRLEELVQFAKRYGSEASQGEVVMQFGEVFFGITSYQ